MPDDPDDTPEIQAKSLEEGIAKIKAYLEMNAIYKADRRTPPVKLKIRLQLPEEDARILKEIFDSNPTSRKALEWEE